ncbi:hypothetical protein F511_19179 [Dorcoceras hygrometricum]|uniref:Dystroglycan-like n=1 Tax=Dorcoceras hygrometricum TaxID=472368 RepID=A0A2Z7A9R6_9LAMI|nr:hypothetical protein F511_19179 [Dorcoceras hygrometricum]
MQSSLFTNTLHVCFDSVLAMDNPGMVSMFEALMASGLSGFLGCPAVLYEDALIEFFLNGSVRDGKVVSAICGKQVETSEELFSSTFELPVDGLIDLSKIPKDIIFYARSIFSLSGEQISTYGKKREMKFEFRLLSDILAKKISVKARSFDAVTQERFLMMEAITCGVAINWNRLLFNIIKDMVTAGSKQAKGYAIQISLLMENVPNLELGDSSEFPSSKILTKKTVHRYIIVNDKVGVEEVADVPRVKKTPVKKVVSRKRPAAVDEPIVKKKRTSVGKAATVATDSALEAVPVQVVAPISTMPPHAPKRKIKKRKRRLRFPKGSDDEVTDERAAVKDVVEAAVEKESVETTANLAVKAPAVEVAAAAFDTVDVRKEVKVLNAKVTDLDGQVATIRSELLDFRAKAEENHLNLSTQLAFLVDYIRRGNAKTGEGGSSRPQPPPDDQNRPSGGSGNRADDPRKYGGGTVSRESGSRGISGSGESQSRGDIRGDDLVVVNRPFVV